MGPTEPTHAHGTQTRRGGRAETVLWRFTFAVFTVVGVYVVVSPLLYGAPAWSRWTVPADVCVFVLVVLGWRLLRQHDAVIGAYAARTRQLSQQAMNAESRAAVLKQQAEQDIAAVQWQIGEVRARWTGEAEACRHAVAHLARTRLPAALAGESVPSAPVDERVDRVVAQLLERIVTDAEQAVAQQTDRRESTQAAALALAQQTQTLAHRIQAEATQMADRIPHNADVLDVSMKVDHAAAVAARIAQSVRVLCGDSPGQQWRRPLAVVEVVRAAAGRITAYTRVQVEGSPDIGVAPQAVEPLIHLIAELLANAAQFSPPTTKVRVVVITVEQGTVIEIDDCGNGLDQFRLDEADEIASGHRPVTLAELGMIAQTGLAVVGEYARRYGFRVRLRGSVYGGLQAVVGVPAELVQAIEPAPAPSAPPAAPEPTHEHAPASGPMSAGVLPQRRSRRRDQPESAAAASVASGTTGAAPVSVPTAEAASAWMGAYFNGPDQPSATDPDATGALRASEQER